MDLYGEGGRHTGKGARRRERKDGSGRRQDPRLVESEQRLPIPLPPNPKVNLSLGNHFESRSRIAAAAAEDSPQLHQAAPTTWKRSPPKLRLVVCLAILGNRSRSRLKQRKESRLLCLTLVGNPRQQHATNGKKSGQGLGI